MSAEAVAAVRTWRAGQYTCTMTVARPKHGAVMHCSIEWAPAPPSQLTKAEIREYRAGRNSAVASISAELGIRAAVIEAS